MYFSSLQLISLLFPDGHWVLIGSQHVVRAAVQIRKEYEKAERKLPEWLTHVDARVIKKDVSLSVRQTIAGENNAVSGDNEPLGMAEISERCSPPLCCIFCHPEIRIFGCIVLENVL